MLQGQTLGVAIEEITDTLLPAEFMQRGQLKPVPDNVSDFLNEQQLLALRTMQYFGWSLWFIRRNETPTVVVINEALSRQFAVLESSGFINMDPSIHLRH